MANTFTGKVWKFGDDINTDLVIPNFAVLMPLEEQLQHCFSANRPGWVDEVHWRSASSSACVVYADREHSANICVPDRLRPTLRGGRCWSLDVTPSRSSSATSAGARPGLRLYP